MHELTTHPITKRVLLALFLLALAASAYLILLPFLVPIAWAGILAYASWPAYRRLLVALGARANVAALLMTLVVAAMVVLPALWLLTVLKNDLSLAAVVVARQLQNGGLTLPNFVANLPLVGTDIADWVRQVVADPVRLKAELQALLAHADQAAIGILGGIGRNLAKLALALLTLFFFYRDGAGFMRELSRVLESMLGERVRGYLEAVGGATRGVVYGIVLTAVAQGAAAGLGYWVAGLEAPVMLAAITAIVALIPFGTPLVWGSLGVWLLLTGEVWAGTGLLLWGALVVLWIDNIVRPLVVAQNVRLPFILAFFGVLGGLAAFGLIGLFIGPVILAVAFAVWQEWLDEHPVEETAA